MPEPPAFCGDAIVALNPRVPAEAGSWSGLVDWSQNDRPKGMGDLVGVHMVHLPTGHVLVWSGETDQYLWDISADTFTPVPLEIETEFCVFGNAAEQFVDCQTDADCVEYCNESNYGPCDGLAPSQMTCELGTTAPDVFCSGHTHGVDGVPVLQGGNITGQYAGQAPRSVFSYDDGSWALEGYDQARRWYPTLTTTWDGKTVLFGGDYTAHSISVFDGDYTTFPLSTTSFPVTGGGVTYPFMFQMMNGDLFYAGCEHPGSADLFEGQVFDPATLQWSSIASGSNIPGGSAVMYAPNKVMKSGGCTNGGSRCQAADGTEVIDLSATTPSWEPACPMPQPRHFHTLTLLPDGTVLMTGGNTEGNGTTRTYCREPGEPFSMDECTSTAECCTPTVDESGGGCTRTCEAYDNAFYATRTAALWWPTSGHWFELGSQQLKRMYHSTAVLLPDARVLSAGNGQRGGLITHKEVEFYSPPYLHWGDRPEVLSAPDDADFGETISVQVDLDGEASPAQAIHRVTMLRLGSVTHQFDQDQRFKELDFVATGPDTLSVTMPANGGEMPPGWTMLFVLTDRDTPTDFLDLADATDAPNPGVPSEGHYIRLNLD